MFNEALSNVLTFISDWWPLLSAIITTLRDLAPLLWFILVVAVLLYLYFMRTFNDTITFGVQWEELEPAPDETDESIMQLKLRTPVDEPIDDVLPKNFFFRFALTRATWRCNENNSFVIMSVKDMAILQPRVINKASATQGSDVFAKWLGLPTISFIVYGCVVFEKYGRPRNRKLRVVLMTREQLEKYSADEESALGFEHSYHSDRIKTLRAIARQWKQEQERPHDPDALKLVMPIELIFRK